MSYLIDSVAQENKPYVQLVGQDGNAFAIMGRVKEAWRSHRDVENYRAIAQEYQDRCVEIMKNGDYNNVLATAMDYINEGSKKETRYYEDDYEDEDEDYDGDEW